MSNIPTCDNGEGTVSFSGMQGDTLHTHILNLLHADIPFPAVIFTAYTTSSSASTLYLGTSEGDFYALDVQSLEWQYVGQRNNVGVAMQYLGPAYDNDRCKDVIVYAGEGADHQVIEVQFGHSFAQAYHQRFGHSVTDCLVSDRIALHCRLMRLWLSQAFANCKQLRTAPLWSMLISHTTHALH